MKTWIEKHWFAWLLPLCLVASFTLMTGVAHVAEARGSATVELSALPATGPHRAAWVAEHPYRPLFVAAVAEPPADDAITTSPRVAPPAPDEDPSGFLEAALAAVRSKNGWVIGSVLVVLVTWLLRVGVRRKVGPLDWFLTDRGGVVLTALVTTSMGLANVIGAGEAPGLDFLGEVLKIWVTAAGLYVTVKRTLKPKDNAVVLEEVAG